MAIPSQGYIRLSYSGGYIDIKPKSVKGLHVAERIQPFPAIKRVYLDGFSETQFKKYRRCPLLNLGVFQDIDDLVKILSWFMDNDRTLSYYLNGKGEDALSFVPSSADGYESEWLDNCVLGRNVSFDLEESIVRKVSDGWPAATV